MPIYIANRVSSKYNIVFPDRLEVNDNNVIYYKGTILGYQTVVIPRKNIASVYGNFGILFADIVVESVGGKQLVASGFNKSDVREIVQLLSGA